MPLPAGGIGHRTDARLRASISPNIYEGTAGVVPTLLLAARLWPGEGYDDAAAECGTYLVRAAARERVPGLYQGLAGIAWALHLLDRPEAVATAGRLAAVEAELPAQLPWLGGFDLLDGIAGIGLTHLRLGLTDAAIASAHRLLALGGPQWKLPREHHYLHFAHGDSGAAFFLSELYRETGEQRWLEVAVSTGEAVLTKGVTRYDVDPVAEVRDRALAQSRGAHGAVEQSTVNLSWCHGVAGTSRLLLSLHSSTHDPRWLGELDRYCAPLHEAAPGIGVTTCHGHAGVLRLLTTLVHDLGWHEYEAATERSVAALDEVVPEAPGWSLGRAGVAYALGELTLRRRGETIGRALPDEWLP